MVYAHRCAIISKIYYLYRSSFLELRRIASLYEYIVNTLKYHSFHVLAEGDMVNLASVMIRDCKYDVSIILSRKSNERKGSVYLLSIPFLPNKVFKAGIVLQNLSFITYKTLGNG